MNTVNKTLAGLAVVQVALTALTWWPHGSGAVEPHDLLGFPVDQIQSITIHGRTSKDEVAPAPTVLTRSEGGGFVLTSSDDYPAADTNVQPLLDALGKLTVRSPVAVKPESQGSLEVAPDANTRKLEVVAKDGTKKVLYFGAAQGQTAHVRVDGENETYDVKGVSAWSIAASDNRYFDRDGFLKVDPDKVKSVTIERPGQPPIELDHDADTWTLAGAGQGVGLDQAATRTFVQSVLTVRMLEPATREKKPEYGFDQGTVVKWTVDDNGSTASHEYRVGTDITGENGRKWVTADTSPWVVKVLASNLKPATEDSIDKLMDEPLEAPASPKK